jgi:hypothetical protein
VRGYLEIGYTQFGYRDLGTSSSAATLTLNEKKTVPRNVFEEKINGKVPGSGNKSIA